MKISRPGLFRRATRTDSLQKKDTPKAQVAKTNSTALKPVNSFRPKTPTQGPVALNAPQQASLPAQDDAVQQATAQVRAAGVRGDPTAAMEVLRQEAEALEDPAQVDALLRECRVEVEAAADRLAERVQRNQDDRGGNRVTRELLGDMAAIADLAGEEGVHQMGEALATRMAARLGTNEGDLNQFDDAFRELAEAGKGSRLALAVADRMINGAGMVDAGNSILDAATQAVGALTGQYNTALQDYAQHEARLAQDLTAFGPGMTEAQRQAYTEAFWNTPEHKEARDALVAAENNLAHALETGGPQLEQLAKRGDADSARKLLEGYEALATSLHHADDALAFVGRLNDTGNAELFAAVDLHTDGDLEDRVGEQLVAPAIPRAQGEAIANAEAGEGQGLEQFESLLAAVKLGKNMPKLAQEVGQLSDTLKLLRENPSQVRFDRLVQNWQDKSRLGKALAVAAVASGIYTAATNPNELERIKAGLGAVKGGLEITAGVLSTFGDAAKVAGAASLAAKFVPYVGLAIDSIQLGQDINNLMTDPNAGEAIAALGTGISILGDLAGCIPVLGTLPDGLLGVLGEVVHGIGGLISNAIEGNQRQRELNEERDRLLQEAGVDAQTRELLTSTDDRLITLTQLSQLGLNREQFLDTVAGFTQTSSAEESQAYQSALSAAAAFGFTGDEAVAFAARMREEFARDPQAMYELQNALGWLDFHSDGSANDSGGTDRRALESDLQTVQIVFSRHFPELAEQYGINDKTVDDVNVPYYAAA